MGPSAPEMWRQAVLLTRVFISRQNSTAAIRAEAAPPKPFNNPTIWGISMHRYLLGSCGHNL